MKEYSFNHIRAPTIIYGYIPERRDIGVSAEPKGHRNRLPGSTQMLLFWSSCVMATAKVYVTRTSRRSVVRTERIAWDTAEILY